MLCIEHKSWFFLVLSASGSAFMLPAEFIAQKDLRYSWRPVARTCAVRGHVHSTSTGLLMSAGFGASSGRSRIIEEVPGAEEAKEALEHSGGDLNRATSLVFQNRLSKLEEDDQELGEMLRALSAGRNRPGTQVESEALHEALVSATWDAVAVMNALPTRRKTLTEEREEKRFAKRLKAIADAARLRPGGQANGSYSQPSASSTQNISTGKILDIGCGDGTLLPHLLGSSAKKKKKQSKPPKARTQEVVDHASQKNPTEAFPKDADPLATVREADFTGVDLSEVMISAARQKHPEARWIVGNAMDLHKVMGMDNPERLFTSIIFNGSLQFFRDPPAVLAEASKWLVDGGHIVIAHVQGSDFVRDECRRNPRVAPSPMPDGDVMQKWATKAGCILLDGPDDLNQRAFFLRIFRYNG